MLTIIVIITVSSCSITSHRNAFFRTYQSINNGVSEPSFLTLKMPVKTYEFYSPTMNLTTIGLWETRRDTLVLIPSLDYTFRKGILYTENLMDSIKSVTSIPKFYLVKNNRLIDITNYGQVIPEIMGDEHSVLTQYKLMK